MYLNYYIMIYKNIIINLFHINIDIDIKNINLF